VIRVQVPSALQPGSKPWIVVANGSYSSSAYPLTAGIAKPGDALVSIAGIAKPVDALLGDEFRKLFGDQFGLLVVAISGATTILGMLYPDSWRTRKSPLRIMSAAILVVFMIRAGFLDPNRVAT
jgi:hypothetical protein